MVCVKDVYLYTCIPRGYRSAENIFCAVYRLLEYSDNKLFATTIAVAHTKSEYYVNTNPL